MIKKRGFELKVLVTGGAVFIGSNLVERLSRDRHSVLVFDNLSTGDLGKQRKFEAKIPLETGINYLIREGK